MSKPEQIAFTRRISIRHEVDVCVAGGGPAGVAAAVTAARHGAQVLIIEGHGCFGGSGTAGMLPVFMKFGDNTHFYADGIGREVLDRLEQAHGRWPPHGLCYKGEALKRVYDDMLEASGVNALLCTHLVGVETDGGHVTHAVCWGKSGLFGIRAKIFVDGTGDGDLCAWAGAPYEQGDESGRMMPGTLCSFWTGIDWERAEAAGFGAWQQRSELPRAFEDGVFTVKDPHLPGMLPVGRDTGGGNIGHVFGVDGTDERSLAQAHRAARKSLVEYQRYYCDYLEGYENAEMAVSAPLLGIRETRRITGDYRLTGADYERRASFEDEIGRYNYWIDTHCFTPAPEDFTAHLQLLRTSPYGEGESYGIPYRCLTPLGLENVLVAGRCVSADRRLQSSIRVMPGCFITGQAAGLAAAMAAADCLTSRQVDVSELQTRLRKMGAYLPDPIGTTKTPKPTE
jgi:hypothetical protein